MHRQDPPGRRRADFCSHRLFERLKRQNQMHRREGGGGRACDGCPLGCPFHELFSVSSRKNCKTVSWGQKQYRIDRGTYVVSVELLLLVELRVALVDTGSEVGGVAAEGDVQVLQEGVATGEQRLGLVGVRVDTRLTVKHNDAVGKVGGHDEIVLDDEGRLLGVHDEPLDNTAGHDTLFGIEVYPM